jgi:hypothetical protein
VSKGRGSLGKLDSIFERGAKATLPEHEKLFKERLLANADKYTPRINRKKGQVSLYTPQGWRKATQQATQANRTPGPISLALLQAQTHGVRPVTFIVQYKALSPAEVRALLNAAGAPQDGSSPTLARPPSDRPGSAIDLTLQANGLSPKGLGQRERLTPVSDDMAARIKGGSPNPPTEPDANPLRAGLEPSRQQSARPSSPSSPDALPPGVTVDMPSQPLTIGGMTLRPNDIAGLAGAQPNTRVIARSVQGRQPLVEIRSDNPSLFNGNPTVSIKVNEQTSRPYLSIDSLNLKDKQRGTGLRVFWQITSKAKELGIDQIQTYALGNYNAMRSGRDTGYYAWPRYGFDGPLQQWERDVLKKQTKLPDSARNAITIQDLMQTPEGREWWKLHGSDREMEFDTRPGSRSQQVLARYRREKGVDEAPPSGSGPTAPKRTSTTWADYYSVIAKKRATPSDEASPPGRSPQPQEPTPGDKRSGLLRGGELVLPPKFEFGPTRSWEPYRTIAGHGQMQPLGLKALGIDPRAVVPEGTTELPAVFRLPRVDG